jgi:hypothetical protein
MNIIPETRRVQEIWYLRFHKIDQFCLEIAAGWEEGLSV